jgi:hypothetical protein
MIGASLQEDFTLAKAFYKHTQENCQLRASIGDLRADASRAANLTIPAIGVRDESALIAAL